MKVLVAGGGIGGLATAVAVTRAGHEVEVFERAAQPAEVGAAVAIWPNGQQALSDLGIDGAPGFPVRTLQLRSRSDRLLMEPPIDQLRERYGYDLVMMHRAELQATLLMAFGHAAVRFSSEVVGFDQDESMVTVHVASGERRQGDLLVGADGLRSEVRRVLLDDGGPRYSGATCWRGVTVFPGLEAAALNWIGEGGECGIFPLSGGRVYWLGVVNRPERESDGPGGRKTDVAGAFAGWPAPMSAVIEATDEKDILRNDLYDRAPIRAWSRGRVTLVGDAAHPMLPNAAQGACSALQDAAALGQALGKHPLGKALDEYETKRLRRANMLIGQARQTARLIQSTNPAVTAFRDFAMSHVPRGLLFRQLDGLMSKT
jgi:2-polyprenyl-6-methoxyphenol hydroxylase-like FAD-dependent oxidoreductase